MSYYEPSNAEMSLACDGSGRSVLKSRGGNDVRGLLGAGAWVASAVEVARVVSAMDGRNDATPDILKYSSVEYMTRNVRGRMPIGWISFVFAMFLSPFFQKKTFLVLFLALPVGFF